MRDITGTRNSPGAKIVKPIKRATRKQYLGQKDIKTLEHSDTNDK